MNILVTGGCGFIGSNFVNFILDNTKENVIVLDKLTYAGNSQNIWRDFERNIILEGDINNYTLLDATHETRGIDLIVHFAAESHVDNSINSPDEFIQTNIVGTHTLLKFALEHNIRFIHISTDEVYGSLGKDDPPSKEGDVYKLRNGIMAENILMLALSPTMEEGVIVKWVKAEGDTIAQGDFSVSVELLSDEDRLGLSINNMTRMLRESKQETDRQNWLTECWARYCWMWNCSENSASNMKWWR